MTEEEIKKLSAEYAEAVCPIEDYDELDDPLRETDIQICEYDAKSVLEWLSRDYCIIPKSKVKERYEESKLRSKSELKFDILIGNSRVSLLESLFNVDDL